MENFTDPNTTTFQFRPKILINDTIFSSVLSALTLYILAALLYYHIKIEKLRKKSFFELSLEKRYGLLSKYTCIAIAVVSMIHYLNSFGLHVLAFYSVSQRDSQNFDVVNSVCDVFGRGILFVAAAGILVFVFLWLRQNIFYVHRSLRTLNNRSVRAFSFVVMILYTLFFISLLVSYLVLVSYRFEQRGGCVFKGVPGADPAAYVKILFSWTAVSILMQVALLGLFLYPMLKQTTWHNNKEESRSLALRKRVIKAIILASICLVSDILALIIYVVLDEGDSSRAGFMFGFNLLIDLVATIACFDHWKKLLWPWNIKCCKIAADAANESHSQTVQTNVIRSVDNK